MCSKGIQKRVTKSEQKVYIGMALPRSTETNGEGYFISKSVCGATSVCRQWGCTVSEWWIYLISYLVMKYPTYLAFALSGSSIPIYI